MTSPRAGTLVEVDGRPALRFERWYRQDVERVWRAVTQPDELRRWFPSDVLGERAVGARLVFDDGSQRAAARQAGEPAREDGGGLFEGTVLAWDPPRAFSFSWGPEVLRVELAAAPEGGTHLVFTQVLSHPSVGARNGAGWDSCLAELDRLLDDPAADVGDWTAVYEDYVDRMGPPLGIAGPAGARTWERATHVPPERVRQAAADPEPWGGRTGDDVHWSVAPGATGTVYRVTVDGAGDDPELASWWHAKLLQLDMWLAASALVPADERRWVADYAT